MTVKTFGITGVAGYIAPTHLDVIKSLGHELVAALDPHDSVGVLDKHFKNAQFFTETERFERHLEKLKYEGSGIDFLSICSPNYLHEAHIRLGLRCGAHVICEKPLVLNPNNLDLLAHAEKDSGKRIYNVLQLRLHPLIQSLRQEVRAEPNKRHQIKLTYVTPRGSWYLYSWKGNKEKSGGLPSNIGIHFFDMLLWIFGPLVHSKTLVDTSTFCSGELALAQADVVWSLSIDENDLPKDCTNHTYRHLLMGDRDIDFSAGFGDLHKSVYQSILDGNGFGLEDIRPAIELVHQITNTSQSI